MLGASFIACSDEDKEIPQEPTKDPVVKLAYILNEGLWGSNNANIICFYIKSSNKVSTTGTDIYAGENGGKPMGDLANAMIEEDENIYVVLNESNYVSRISLSIKE